MNEGLGVEDIVARIRPPSALFDHPFMRPVYGCVDYIVRDIWRSENGWWDRNPTTLHPAPRWQVEADLQSLLGSAADVQHVVARAHALAEAGQIQHALHVIDLVAQLPEDTPMHSQIRDFKADLLDRRALQVSSVVSRNLYRSMAEQLRGLPHGSTRDHDPTHGMTMA
jgi:alkyl sulfatase BDS1-like metallo-beta-lactamase superfamily hydrolase